MKFEKTPPAWNAKGEEPPSALKNSGFQAGYKPPATYFNWFWNKVSTCLTELQAKLSNVDNTADVEKSVKYANGAGKADRVKSSMIVHLNGGNTEGTDQFTFDGSAGKDMDVTADKVGAAPLHHAAQHRTGGSDPITPQDIGAALIQHTHTTAQVSGLDAALNGKAPTSHTHSKSQITDFPSALPASDVYDWAKQPQKPSYSALEVGAVPADEHNGYNFVNKTLNSANIDTEFDYNYTVGISESGHGTTPNNGTWFIVINHTCHHFIQQIATHCDANWTNKQTTFVRSRWIGESGAGWSEWMELADAATKLTLYPYQQGTVDFNTLVKEGRYNHQGSNLNTPYGNTQDSHFRVDVYVNDAAQTDAWIRQVAFDVRSQNYYTRTRLNSNWQPWQKVILADDLNNYLPTAGGTISGGISVNTLSLRDYGTPFECSGYIDFHAPGTNTDFTGRLQALSNGRLMYYDGVTAAANGEVITTGNAPTLLASQKAGLQLLQDVTVQQSGLTRISVSVPSTYWSDWKAIHMIMSLKNYTSVRFEDPTISRLNLKNLDWWIVLHPHYDPTFALTIDYNSTIDHGRVISVTQKFQELHTVYFQVIESNGVTTMQPGSRIRFYGEK